MSRRSKELGYKVDQIIENVNVFVLSYQASECVNHRRKMCFKMISNHDSKIYHALVDGHSSKWFRLSPNSSSFDFPQSVFYMIKLNETLSSKYVLKYASQLRDPGGETYYLFQIQSQNMYTAARLAASRCLNAYVGFIVFLSEVSYLCGGTMPDIGRMKFFFNEDHPILADVGKLNCEASASEHNPSKWSGFMIRTKPTVVTRYMTGLLPAFFRKRRRKDPSSRCLFRSEVTLDDLTHSMICKTSNDSLCDVLKKYVSVEGVLPYKPQAEQIIERVRTHLTRMQTL